jgi:hypothetical protein
VIRDRCTDGRDVLHGSFLLGFLHSCNGIGDKKSSKNSDDSDNDEQLDQRETSHFFEHLKPPNSLVFFSPDTFF